jgi:hypothetical protein
MRKPIISLTTAVLLSVGGGCREDDGHGDDTTLVGAFEGLHDDAAVGFNFPFDVGIVPDDPETDEIEGGDIIVANYGTSEVMLVENPTEHGLGQAAVSFFDGTTEDLRGAMAVSVPHHERIWAAFEQGGDGGHGGIVVLDADGRLALTNRLHGGSGCAAASRRTLLRRMVTRG